jgi:hypothetical protein
MSEVAFCVNLLGEEIVFTDLTHCPSEIILLLADQAMSHTLEDLYPFGILQMVVDVGYMHSMHVQVSLLGPIN